MKALEIPTKPLDLTREHEGLAEESAKLFEFQTRAVATEKAIATVLEKMSRSDKSRVSEIEREAIELVNDGPSEAVLTSGALRQQLIDLQHQRAVLGRATEIQKKKVERVEREASRAIAQKLRPSYRQLVEETGAALVALGRLQVREIQVADLVRESGMQHVSSILPRAGIAPLGDPRERGSYFELWFREQLDCGLLDKSAIPPEWREAWA